jgi:glycogen(starch) synthase
MKALFVSNLFPPLALGGYEQGCFDIAQGLRVRGHTVQILASAFRSHLAPQDEQGVFRALKLKSNYNMVESGPTPWVARNRLDLEWHNSRAMRRAIDSFRPEVVLFYNGGNMGRALISAAEERSTVAYSLSDPWLAPVLAARGADQRRSPARTAYHLALSALGIPDVQAGNDHLIFCSRSIQSKYEEMGANVSRGTVIYHGVTPDKWPLRQQRILHSSQQSGDNAQRILYVGRLSHEKGVSTLVRAFARMHNDMGFRDTQLRLIGSAQGAGYEEYLTAEIEKHGLERAVEVLPQRPRSDMPDVYAEHDVLAFTSEAHESFSRTLLEAMSTGLPVVSSLIGGSAEIIRDGKNAVAFRAGDAEDLAVRLAWVLTHSEEAAALGIAASEEVRKRYTLDAQVRAIEAFLEPLALQPRAARTGTRAVYGEAKA